MRYTIRNVSEQLDRALRQQAQREKKSLNEFLLEALARSIGIQGEPPIQRDLSDIVGTWHDDPEMNRIFEEQRRVDPKLWR